MSETLAMGSNVLDISSLYTWINEARRDGIDALQIAAKGQLYESYRAEVKTLIHVVPACPGWYVRLSRMSGAHNPVIAVGKSKSSIKSRINRHLDLGRTFLLSNSFSETEIRGALRQDELSERKKDLLVRGCYDARGVTHFCWYLSCDHGVHDDIDIRRVEARLVSLLKPFHVTQRNCRGIGNLAEQRISEIASVIAERVNEVSSEVEPVSRDVAAYRNA